MQPVLPILHQGSGSSQLREFACGKTALTVHLEEAFLGMKIAQGPSEVSTGAPGERRHPLCVTRYSDWRGEFGRHDGSLQHRETGAHLHKGPGANSQGQDPEHAGECQNGTAPTRPWRKVPKHAHELTPATRLTIHQGRRLTSKSGRIPGNPLFCCVGSNMAYRLTTRHLGLKPTGLVSMLQHCAQWLLQARPSAQPGSNMTAVIKLDP
jgi:hypothetical protein